MRFVQPFTAHWAFTAEVGLNETLVGANNSGRVAMGVQFGNWVQPKDFAGLKHPVPMDIPRIRYELLTRLARTGNSQPVAITGPDKLGVSSGLIQLDGSPHDWFEGRGPHCTLIIFIDDATNTSPTGDSVGSLKSCLIF